MTQPSPVDAAVAAVPSPRREPIGLYVNVAVAVPDRIADRLPEPRPGVRPHVTVVHTQVDIDQYQRLRAAFAGASATLVGLAPIRLGLDGVGDFRTDASAVPAVYLRVVDETGALARLAAALDTEFGLRRRFAFHPHVTLAWRNRDLELAAGDAELDRILADHANFRAEWTANELTLQTASGTILTPRRLTWGTSHTYPFA